METRGDGVSKHKSLALGKMETLVRQMQSQECGVPVRCQKLFLTTIPSAFMGYDLIEWLMENLPIEDSAEALHLASLLCQHGYFFPVGDTKTLQVKDDSSLYRFQTPYYWPSQNHVPDSTDYAIYLHKKISKNKQKHGLEEYELEAYNQLKKTLASKWDFVTMQAEEQLKMAKDRKKGDKIVSESQERAYWRVYRPPPGFTNTLEMPPVPDRSKPPPPKVETVVSLSSEMEFLRKNLVRSRSKQSQVAESLISNFETYLDFDPLLSPVLPSNPWLTDDPTFMELNEPLVECPTERRVRRWAVSMDETVADPTGLAEFTNCMKKEFSHENIRFWTAVHQLKKAPLCDVEAKVKSIYDEFLRPGAPCEINIDGKTMEKTQELLKNPSRFTYDYAAEHIYELLLKKDCYPRFLRSEHYKNLLLNATNPTSKKSTTSSTKKFFTFGAPGKKKISTVTPPNPSQLVVAPGRHGNEEKPADGGPGGARPECDPPYRKEEDAGVFLGGPSTPPPVTSPKLPSAPSLGAEPAPGPSPTPAQVTQVSQVSQVAQVQPVPAAGEVGQKAAAAAAAEPEQVGEVAVSAAEVEASSVAPQTCGDAAPAPVAENAPVEAEQPAHQVQQGPAAEAEPGRPAGGQEEQVAVVVPPPPPPEPPPEASESALDPEPPAPLQLTPPAEPERAALAWDPPLAIAPPPMFQDLTAPLASIDESAELVETAAPPVADPTPAGPAEVASGPPPEGEPDRPPDRQKDGANAYPVPEVASADPSDPAVFCASQPRTEIVTLTDSCAQTVETGDSPVYSSTIDKQCEANLEQRHRGTRRKEKRVKICDPPAAASSEEPAASGAPPPLTAGGSQDDTEPLLSPPPAETREKKRERKRSSSTERKKERKESKSRKEAARKKSSSERRRCGKEEGGRLEGGDLEAAAMRTTSPKKGNVVAPTEGKPIPQKLDETNVCPWENEESCKVDAPFVKTYATFGYL